MRNKPPFRPPLSTTLALVSLLAAHASANAALTEVDIGKTFSYQQTSSGVAFFGTFFAARAYMQDAADFDGGTLAHPGTASSNTLAPGADGGGVLVGYQTGYITPAELSAGYGFGDYAFTATNSSTLAAQSATVNYTHDTFTADVPAMAQPSFLALQGVNAALPMTVSFNGFTAGAGSDAAYTYFSIFDRTTDNFVFVDGLLPVTTNTESIAAGTLTAGHAYRYEINFSSRLIGADAGSGLPTQQYFDVRTFGDFTAAAVPEPGVYALMLAGLGLIDVARRRRKHSRA